MNANSLLLAPTEVEAPTTEQVEPDVRRTMSRLPFQPFWTWLTGKPAKGEQPIVHPAPFAVLALGVLCLGASAVFAYWLFDLRSVLALPLLLISWITFVSGARLLQVTIVHHAAHRNFVGIEWVDRCVAQVVTAILFIQEFDGYRKDHVSIHHSKQLATLTDPDLKFLVALGFRPGMSKRALWKHLGKVLISPEFHWLFLQARLRSNFSAAPVQRRIISWLSAALYAGLAVHAYLAGPAAVGAFVFGWLFPLIVPYQMSSLLQFSSEHRWLRTEHPDASKKLVLARLTAGRFMGEAAPVQGGGAGAWTRWWLRVLFLHVPARVFVIVGDLPQHDWHHRHPTAPWTLAAYARQQDVEAGHPKWPEGYSEVWGLDKAVDSVFALWSELPALSEEELQLALTTRESDEVLTGM